MHSRLTICSMRQNIHFNHLVNLSRVNGLTPCFLHAKQEGLAEGGFVPVLAAVLCDQFFLTSSEGCFFDIQALSNNTFNPVFQVCLMMQTREESSSGGKDSRKR